MGSRSAQGTTPITRRGALLAGASLAATLAACNQTGTSGVAAGGGARKKYRFVFVNHVTTNPFFTATQYGAADACAALGCTYTWTGSETSNVSEMVRAVQTAINENVDGIAVSIVDPTAFNSVAAAAIDKGIPVVAYNADAPPGSGNRRLAYIGQDLFASGQHMGERIASLVPAGSHVALFIATPGSLNIQPRIDGAVDAIKKSGKGITYEQVASGALVAQERSAVESYYLGHKSAKGLFAVDAGSTEAVALLSRKYGLAKSGVATGGYDLLPSTIDAVQAGNLTFTIDQQPYLQGFYPIQQLYLYKASGTLMAPSDTDTGLKFVTKDTVAPYVRPSRYEGAA
jgi:simple sugar transport system substrate-binding protein